MSRERVLVYRLGSLGDTVVAVPCFHAIERAFPDAERIVLTNLPVSAKAAPLEAVLGGSGLVHGVLSYPVGVRSIGGLLTLRRQIRELGARTLVYLTPARGRVAAWRDVLFFRACGIRRIVGAPLSPSLQQNLPDGRGGIERECDRLARCLHAIGPVDCGLPASWDLRLSDAEQAHGRRLVEPFDGHRFLVVNMGGKVLKNDWGEDRWSELLPRLGARLAGWGLLVVGGPEDGERARRACRNWPGPSVDATGRAAPRVSAAAMARGRLFIGHDSGPMHLAAAVGLPCVGLFGDNNPPRKWHPVGDRHRVLHRMDGVRAIAVAEVEAAVAEIVSADAAASFTHPEGAGA